MSTAQSSRLLPRRTLQQCLRNPPPPLRPHHRHPIRTITYRSTASSPSTLNAAPKNPLDIVNAHRAELQRQAHYKRRRNFAAWGAAISMLVPILFALTYPVEELEKGVAEKKEREARRAAERAEFQRLNARALGRAADMAEGGDGSSSAGGSWLPRERADASEADNKMFQGKEVIVKGGGAKIVAHDGQTGEELELVPTGTSSIPHFPRTIHVASSAPSSAESASTTASGARNEEDNEYTLLGLGVRSVSFLGIQVYVVGLYVQTSSLAALQASMVRHINPLGSALIPGEKAQLRESLLDPEKSREVWDKLLKSGEKLKMA
ncbi:hypothetical protein LTS18_013829, partial [Coniosporium uncinatum]